jgi:hypothetical protein
VQGTSAAGGRYGVVDIQVRSKSRLKPVDIFVAALAPAIGRSIRNIGYFVFGNGWLRVENALLHNDLGQGTMSNS